MISMRNFPDTRNATRQAASRSRMSQTGSISSYRKLPGEHVKHDDRYRHVEGEGGQHLYKAEFPGRLGIDCQWIGHPRLFTLGGREIVVLSLPLTKPTSLGWPGNCCNCVRNRPGEYEARSGSQAYVRRTHHFAGWRFALSSTRYPGSKDPTLHPLFISALMIATASLQQEPFLLIYCARSSKRKNTWLYRALQKV